MTPDQTNLAGHWPFPGCCKEHQAKPDSAEQVPVAKRWAVYYDNCGKYSYTNGYVNGIKNLYRTKEEAESVCASNNTESEKFYTPRELIIFEADSYAAPLNITQQAPEDKITGGKQNDQ